MADERKLASALSRSIVSLEGGPRDYDALLDRIGGARFVLVGEASHGTHDFYCERARITERLIKDKGFDAVAVEADWPDAHRVSRWVTTPGAGVTTPGAGVTSPGAGVTTPGGDGDAEEALRGFRRFPTWMWRNADVLDFVGWLRDHNETRASSGRARVGFYGLDLYSMFASIEAVLAYLDRVDPEAAARARARYACFENFGEDTTLYAHSAGLGLRDSCEREAVEQLVELRARTLEHAARDGGEAGDELFFAAQNARLVANAEAYYRHMFQGSVATWNLRDRHMVDTLGELAAHLDRALGRPSKIVVWAHNSHLGDARATEMSSWGEVNVGQLARERYGRDAFLIGMTTYSGTVTAASDWDEPAARMTVRPALAGSHEALLHATGVPRFVVVPDPDRRLPEVLRARRLERAIGVVYRPRTERASHWFDASLAAQFDAVVHVDRSRAVEPLERTAAWHAGEAPETYPFAV